MNLSARTAIFLAAALLVAVCAAPMAQAEEVYAPHTYKEMPYRLMSPLNFDATKKYPVILSLHGAGGKGTDNRRQLKDWNKQLSDKKMRTDYPCYVLAPQSKGMWGKEHLDKSKEIIRDLPSVDQGN